MQILLPTIFHDYADYIISASFNSSSAQHLSEIGLHNDNAIGQGLSIKIALYYPGSMAAGARGAALAFSEGPCRAPDC